MEDTHQYDLVILGGGPAGCSLAWYAVHNELKVLVIEAETKAGGLGRSWKWENFIVDTGPHIFHSPDKEITRDWMKFEDLFEEGQYRSANYMMDQNEYIPYPLSKNTIRQMGIDIKDVEDKKKTLISNYNVEISKNFKEYVTALVGEEIEERFFRNYPEKVWGIPTIKMIADWAPKRIRITEEIESFFQGQFCAVSKKGTGEIFKRIREEVEEKGSKFSLKEKVEALEYNDTRINAIRTSKRRLTISNKTRVISTLPITLMMKWLNEDIDLKFRGVMSTYLCLEEGNKEWPEEYSWVYYQDKRLSLNRITEPVRLCEKLRFQEGRYQSYIIAETTYNSAEVINNKRERENLKNMAKEDLKKLGFMKNEKQSISHNFEHYVYPVQDYKYRFEYKKAMRVLAKYGNLNIVGASADFHYSDMQIIFRKSKDMVYDIIEERKRKGNQNSSLSRNKFYESKDLTNKKKNKKDVKLIAEIGINHNGNILILNELIDKCADAGAEIIKLQYYEVEKRIAKEIRQLKYNEKAQDLENNLSDILSKSYMSFDEIRKACERINERKKEIMVSCFSKEGFMQIVNKTNIKYLKVASMDANNIEILNYLKNLDSSFKIFISTGMCEEGEIKKIIEVMKDSKGQITLMQCTSSYPAPAEEINLNNLLYYKEIIPKDWSLGFSDHTYGDTAMVASVHYDVEYIEKHVTLSKHMRGPDHYQSLTPDEIIEVKKKIKTHIALQGSKQKEIQVSEYETWISQKKSIHASKRIEKGMKMEKGMFSIKSPPDGNNPLDIKNILGNNSQNTYEEGEPLQENING